MTVPAYLNNINIILCRTSHPANIGAAARAMKTMGLHRLTLVAPNLIATPMTAEPPAFPADAPHTFRLPEESHILASGATDVLDNCRVVAHLNDALADSVLSCALTSRRRELTAPLQTPRQLTPELLQAAQNGLQVALVFGNETNGLSIDEVQACNRLMTINGNPDYFSLNLAQAVQVVCYEIFSQTDNPMTHLQQDDKPASHQQVQGMMEHLQQTMHDIDFFRHRNSERMMRRMNALFHRAAPTREDIDILRGFYKRIQQKTATHIPSGSPNHTDKP